MSPLRDRLIRLRAALTPVRRVRRLRASAPCWPRWRARSASTSPRPTVLPRGWRITGHDLVPGARSLATLVLSGPRGGSLRLTRARADRAAGRGGRTAGSSPPDARASAASRTCFSTAAGRRASRSTAGTGIAHGASSRGSGTASSASSSRWSGRAPRARSDAPRRACDATRCAMHAAGTRGRPAVLHGGDRMTGMRFRTRRVSMGDRGIPEPVDARRPGLAAPLPGHGRVGDAAAIWRFVAWRRAVSDDEPAAAEAAAVAQRQGQEGRLHAAELHAEALEGRRPGLLRARGQEARHGGDHPSRQRRRDAAGEPGRQRPDPGHRRAGPHAGQRRHRQGDGAEGARPEGARHLLQLRVSDADIAAVVARDAVQVGRDLAHGRARDVAEGQLRHGRGRPGHERRRATRPRARWRSSSPRSTPATSRSSPSASTRTGRRTSRRSRSRTP